MPRWMVSHGSPTLRESLGSAARRGRCLRCYPKPVMNCRNCGAPMELMGARRYYFCRHCGSFHFPEAVDEGVRVLSRPANPRSCAVCRNPMARALLDEVHEVEYCENCRGVLLPRSHFAEIVQRRRAWATSPPVPPEPLNPRELQRVVRCPACARQMATHPYYGPGNVVLESCEACDLVWLDHGELRQIVDTPGRDRGSREQPAVRRGREAPSAGDVNARRYARSSSASVDLSDLFDLLS